MTNEPEAIETETAAKPDELTAEQKAIADQLRKVGIRKMLAIAEALWIEILGAGFESGTALKIRDRDDFSTLSDSEKLTIVTTAKKFLQRVDVIGDRFDIEIKSIINPG